MRQIAVIGLGRFGNALARELTAQGAEVIAVDRREELVEEIKDNVAYAATLSATDESALRGIGIQDVDAAAVCIGDDVEANLLATLLLKKMGVKTVWSRAIDPLQQDILERLGVDSIMNLEEEMGRSVARSLVSTGICKHIPLGQGYGMAEVAVPEPFVGKTLRALSLRTEYNVNVVAIKKPVPQITDTGERTFGEVVENIPVPDQKLEEGDILVVVGTDADIASLGKE